MLTIANLIPLLSLIALGTIFTYAVLLSYNHQFDVLALQPPHLKLVMVNGIAIGDVAAHSAIVWSRKNNEARMHVQYDTDPNFSHPITDQVMQIVNKTTDFSGHMKIEGLRDSTPYYYRVWFSDPNERNIN